MDKHTPGPWTVDGCGMERKRADGSPWRSLTISTPGDNPATVAEVCIKMGGKWKDETARANAALIAAAPDLLAALEAVASIGEAGVIEKRETEKPTWYALDAVKVIARAALARARGEK